MSNLAMREIKPFNMVKRNGELDLTFFILLKKIAIQDMSYSIVDKKIKIRIGMFFSIIYVIYLF